MSQVLDRAEFGRLFVEHARVLWVVAAAFVPKAAVDDVLQDAAATALSRLHDFDPASSFRAWMVQIVRFTAANARRRGRRDDRLELANADDVATLQRPDPWSAIDRNGELRNAQTDFDDCVLRALQDLSAEARACLLLRVVMDLSYREIAASLGLAEGTVASHVHRAREALRRSLAAATSTPTNSAQPAARGGRT